MKYKAGDETLLGKIVTASMGSFPYLVDGRWRFTESEIDKIIIKPKRNIDHLAELREMDSGAAYKFWKDNSRMNPVCYEDVAFMLAPYTEPSKHPQLTPEEIKALKLARELGFTDIKGSSFGTLNPNAMLSFPEGRLLGKGFCTNYIPAFFCLNNPEWLTDDYTSINELLKDEV
jgi:hypothetical protein